VNERPRPPDRRLEIEGFLRGVEHRLRARQGAGPPEEPSETELTEARAAIRRADWSRAEALLRTIDERLESTEPEDALREWPRGLVAFRGPGEASPPSEYDDPIANRLVLVARLLEIRRSQGWDVAEMTRTLHAADRALRAGDRARAKALGDQVHAELDGGTARRDPLRRME
jgi:hypothetical protein